MESTKKVSMPDEIFVLVVDDDADSLAAIESDMIAYGYNLRCCNSPAEALEVIKNHTSHIMGVVSDFKMPEKTGFELRQDALNAGLSCPYVMLSGFITREMALQAVGLKIAAFIDKPYQPEDLLAVFEREINPAIEAYTEERELIDGFVEESAETIETIEELVLELEVDGGSIDTIDKIYAIAHTIKGTSAFFKPDTLNVFTHNFEELLSKIKKKEVPICEEVVTIILKSVDTIKELMIALRDHTIDKFDKDELLKILEIPDLDKVKSSAAASQAKNTQANQAQKDEVRVATTLLDEFLESSGEITVIRNMIKKLVRRVEKQYGNNASIAQLSELLDEMHKINTHMQNQISDIRKVKFKSLCRTFPRLIRDMSARLEKEIELTVTGESVKVDNQIAKVLNNSLTHMMRNCADHAIEPPEDREKKGKSKTGQIKLECSEVGEEITITLSDDGRGLNTENIKRKAIENQMYTIDELAQMSAERIYEIIFEPGFSTAKEVTDISGRGVGMDMVKKSVESIGGKIEIRSQLDAGTTFRLRLPIPRSVLIVNCLLINCGQNTFAIPQENILRVIHIDETNYANYIYSLEGGIFLKLDDEILPIENLAKKLNISESDLTKEMQLVVVEGAKNSFALAVDEILEVEDTVSKKLSQSFKKLEMFSGATFLGDGKIGLTLDIEGLENHLNHENETATESASSAQKKTPDDNTESAHIDTKKLLLFAERNRNLFSVEVSEIERLERFNTGLVKFAGKRHVVIYRDSVMPLVSFSGLIGTGDNLENIIKERDELHCLVIESPHGYYGLVIDEVLDLVESSAEIDRALRTNEFVSGTTIINGKTYTVIDSHRITGHLFGKEKLNEESLENVAA